MTPSPVHATRTACSDHFRAAQKFTHQPWPKQPFCRHSREPAADISGKGCHIREFSALLTNGTPVANSTSKQRGQRRRAVSDRNLERGIRELLKVRHIGGLTIWEVHAENGIATVRGRAESAYAKRACRECCRHVSGVRGVVDLVELA
jgi:osmotically-inducible protein OsmY